MSCGRLCIEKRNAVLVPRRFAGFAESSGIQRVRIRPYDTEERAVRPVARFFAFVLLRQPVEGSQQHLAKARTGSVFLFTFKSRTG